MSSKLVVEFYDDRKAQSPVAVVLAFQGGDNPEDAALTVATLLSQVRSGSEYKGVTAGALAVRFIVWQQSFEGDLGEGGCPAAILIAPEPRYGYQVVRIHCEEGVPRVTIVPDEYTQEDEMEAAQTILDLILLPSVAQTVYQ